MPTVTDLKRPRGHKDRFNLFVDKKFATTIPDYLADRHRLKKGVQISEEVLTEIMQEAEKFLAEESAYRSLSLRPHSQKELRLKLKNKGFSPEAIRAAMTKCRKSGYLDDRRFAEAWTRSRLVSRPRGIRLLIAELRFKGVEQNIAEEAVAEALAETSEADLALQLLEKNRRKLLHEKRVDLKLKIAKFLAYRGFDFGTIRTASQKFMESLTEEEAAEYE